MQPAEPAAAKRRRRYIPYVGPHGWMPTRRGRPTLYRPDLCAKAREHCRRGASLDQLARLLGVAPRSIDNWIAGIPEFAVAVREGRAVADAELDRELYQRAVGYTQTVERPVRCRGRIEVVTYTRHRPPDARACMRWLCRRLPQDWRRRPDLPMKRARHDRGVNPAHLIDADAVEVGNSLHALVMGYVQPVERVVVCHGEPVIVRTTRQHRPHVRAGMFWLCNRLPEQWRYAPLRRAQKTVRHPDRSAQRGAEGPPYVDPATDQVPPLRLVALGSGRDDVWCGVNPAHLFPAHPTLADRRSHHALSSRLGFDATAFVDDEIDRFVAFRRGPTGHGQAGNRAFRTHKGSAPRPSDGLGCRP